MSSQPKYKAASRAKHVLGLVQANVEDPDFWNTFDQNSIISDAISDGVIFLPDMPIKDGVGSLEFSEKLSTEGEIEKYRYQILDCNGLIRTRFESPDCAGDTEHMHIYGTPGDHNTATKRQRKRPELEEVFDLFNKLST